MKKESKNQIIIYEGDDGESRIEVRFEGETVWLSQAQLVELFDSSKANINEHIKNIYSEKELTAEATVRNFRTVQTEGGREVSRDIEHYNLDLIISLGYRVRSHIATKFRIWATARLREYILKGFTMDDERLKGTGGGNYWKELLERIRDIRSSEKVLYRQVLDLYATSTDYDPKSEESKTFFATVQNKLHYAVNTQTAAELIYNRADAEKEFMGLSTFSGKMPIKTESIIAKNYLTKDELYRLNRLVSAFFDLAEIKAQDEEPMRMKDWVAELDKFAEIYGKGRLENAGKISHKEAMKKVEEEYRKYQVKTLSPVEKDYLKTIREAEKKITKKAKPNKK
ncbi:MAG: virulence RhuM family protein [Candidatus Moranbacteria bacterium]|nr:virulence RhuM family protein [Candidatus Moranbacteria bacterium]